MTEGTQRQGNPVLAYICGASWLRKWGDPPWSPCGSPSALGDADLLSASLGDVPPHHFHEREDRASLSWLSPRPTLADLLSAGVGIVPPHHFHEREDRASLSWLSPRPRRRRPPVCEPRGCSATSVWRSLVSVGIPCFLDDFPQSKPDTYLY